MRTWIILGLCCWFLCLVASYALLRWRWHNDFGEASVDDKAFFFLFSMAGPISLIVSCVFVGCLTIFKPLAKFGKYLP